MNQRRLSEKKKKKPLMKSISRGRQEKRKLKETRKQESVCH